MDFCLFPRDSSEHVPRRMCSSCQIWLGGSIWFIAGWGSWVSGLSLHHCQVQFWFGGKTPGNAWHRVCTVAYSLKHVEILCFFGIPPYNAVQVQEFWPSTWLPQDFLVRLCHELWHAVTKACQNCLLRHMRMNWARRTQQLGHTHLHPCQIVRSFSPPKECWLGWLYVAKAS